MKGNGRKFRNADQARKSRENEASWEELLVRHSRGLFESTKRTSGVVSPTAKSGIPDYKHRSSASVGSGGSTSRSKSGNCTGPSIEAPHYEGEMLEREIKAKEEIERKKKRVAIAYNKGAYQYITDDCDPKTIGKK